ncbi:iron ABC transporter permease [uncultured Actinobacillus sp.]|uniref:ABC transporter permease n=1 Tax=uncultured Actinobacillus sp. TaxID=417616 RepID=UPI0025D9474F|nr:iron ABC transporter permease [uncultured Actinobacillus sp.]
MHLFSTRSPLWLILPVIAFIALPTQALHYGLWGSTSQEWLAVMGWHEINLSWVWFGSFLAIPWVKSPKNRLYALIGITSFILLSATFCQIRLGYAVLFLFLSLFMLTVEALAQLRVMQGERFIIGSLLAVFILLFVFILYPSLAIFSHLFYEDGTYSLQSAKQVFLQSHLLNTIWNSLRVSASVGLLSTLLGLCLALYTTRIAKKTQFLGKLFSILPIVTPPFVVGLGVVLLMGRTGYITQILVEYFGVSKNWLYGFNGILISHTLALTPMAFMVIEGALKYIPAQFEEASYSLRGSANQTFRFVLFPLLKPALGNAFLITFVQSLADFSTPFVLGGNYEVLAGQIYFYIVGAQPNYAAASTMGFILLSFSLLCFLIQYWWIGKRTYTTVSGKGNQTNHTPLTSGLKKLIICILVIWVLFNAVLYGSIFFGSVVVNWGVDHSFTLKHYLRLFGQGIHFGGFPSLIHTVTFALCAAPITAIIGLLIAYLTARKPFKGKKYFEFLTLLCFAVPGTVAGLSYVMAFNNAPFYLTGTSIIIVLSMVTRNMPIGMRSAMAGLAQIDKSLEEASLTLKGSAFDTFRFIVLPLLKPALLSALVTSFVRSMTTISAIIFLVTPNTQVATSYILSRVEDGDYGLAVAYGSTLILVMMAVIFGFNKLIYRKG